MMNPREYISTLQWRHNESDGVSNHQPQGGLLNRLSRHRSQKTSKLRVTDLCAANLSVTGEFPAQMASNAENVSIWWRHHESRGFLETSARGADDLSVQNYRTFIGILMCKCFGMTAASIITRQASCGFVYLDKAHSFHIPSCRSTTLYRVEYQGSPNDIKHQDTDIYS